MVWVQGAEVPTGSLFANPTDAERRRLTELTRGLTTIAAAVEALGEPDHDYPTGYSETTPKTATSGPRTTVHRAIEYTRLSETARVMFTERCDGNASVSFVGKYIGPRTKPEGV